VASGVAAVIPAAGTGSRLVSAGTAEPKAFRLLGGRPLLSWSVAALSPFVDVVVVAVPAAYAESRHPWLAARSDVTVVTGGSSRQQSVRLALEAVEPDTEYVVVHDAARPFVPSDVTVRVIDALRGGAAAVVPVVPVVDSLRRVASDGDSVSVARAAMRAVQTPQGFRRDVLAHAHREIDDPSAADDATLVELSGVFITLVPGSELAFKITRPLDLTFAEAVLASSHTAAPDVPSPE
jgi:2-C-methyl-D-erythritol 4-phosphate cytidylyltransferase